MAATTTYKCSLVNGVLRLPCITKESMQQLSDGFVAREGDVVVATYPKSGTTWMQQILKLIENRGIDDRTKPTRFTWVEVNGLQALKEAESPRFMQTHLSYDKFPGTEPAKTPGKFICVARNPKDVAVSYYYHTLGFELYEYDGDWDDFFERFISGEVVDGDWFDHVLGWWKHKDSPNILFLKYEDMKQNPRDAVIQVIDFLGYRFDSDVIESIVKQSSFEYMRDNPATNFSKGSLFARKDGCVPFIRKGVVGDWKNMFTPSQTRQMDEKYEQKMTNSDLYMHFK